MKHRGVVALLAGAAIGACGGDSTSAPDIGMKVVVSLASTRGPTVGASTSGIPLVSCEIDLVAAASGIGTANWGGATFHVYLGKSTASLDSASLSSADVAIAWGAVAIAGGQTRMSTWTLESDTPFSGDLVFSYQMGVGSPAKSTKVTFACSPPFTSESPAPLVTSVSVTPQSGVVNAGSSLSVGYSVTAPAGLWQTQLNVGGACALQQLFTERFETSFTRTLSVKLPASCRLGVPLTVSISAFDAVGQVASRSAALSLVLADIEQPTALARFNDRDGVVQFVASGDYFGGESLRSAMFASDNYSLAAVIWEVLPYGVKDSAIVSGANVSLTPVIPLRPEWSGPIQISVTVRDSVGLVSPVFVTRRDSIRVYPTVPRPTRTAVIDGDAREFVIDERRGMIYLAQGFEQRIAVISMATLQVVTTLPLGALPRDVDLTPSGDTLLIAMTGRSAIGIVDLRQPTLSLKLLPITGLDVANGQTPVHLRAMSNGRVFVATEGNVRSTYQLLDVNLATGVQRTRQDIAVDGYADVQLERSLDHAVLAVNQSMNPPCLRRYVAATDAFSACGVSRVPGLKPTVDATGQRIGLRTDVYDAALQLLPGLGPSYIDYTWFTVLSSNGQFLFEPLTPLGILTRNAADGRLVDRTPNPFREDMHSHVSADGKLLVLMSRAGPTRIGIVDLR